VKKASACSSMTSSSRMPINGGFWRLSSDVAG
jgi:hypothetical protein